MSEYIQTYLALGKQLDALTLTGFTVAGLVLFGLARQYYVHFSTPPAYRIQPWYPIPDDLPHGPVAPYGAPDVKASYKPNMSLGVNGSVGMHLFLIVSMLLTAHLLRKEPVHTIIPGPEERWKKAPEHVSPPPPLDPARNAAPAEKFVPGPPPPPIVRIPIPVPDTRANLLTTILGMTEPDLGPSFSSPGSSIWDKGTGPIGGPDNYSIGVQSEETIDLNIVEQLPELVTIPLPDYPELARAAKREGVVMLNVLIGKDGRVKSAKIQKSIPMLDEPALVAALQAVFRPALWRNEPVAVWVSMPIRFSLHEE